MSIAAAPNSENTIYSAHLPTRSWTRAEYYAAAEAGIFGVFERLELIEGDIVSMCPNGVRHVNSTQKMYVRARAAFRRIPCIVRKEDPIVVDDGTEPEPDIAVVRGVREDYAGRHPCANDVLLIVEVSDLTLRGDREQKGRVYAQAGIPDYWVVNLIGRRLEVYRDPKEVDGVWNYHTVLTFDANDSVAPLNAPKSNILVSDILA
jgi:Uma2 family endonuclease